MLATVWPATTLTFDAVGWAAPAGHTVRYVAAVGSVTVTFSATATASAGMSAWPATCSALVSPPPSGDASVPMPERVSMMRAGTIGWNDGPAAAAATPAVAVGPTTATSGTRTAPAVPHSHLTTRPPDICALLSPTRRPD